MRDLCEKVSRRFVMQNAIRAQKLLASKVRVEDDYGPIRVVAGLDVAYVKSNQQLGVGVAVALSYPSLKVVDCQIYVAPVCIPYIPGLLAFRESSVLVPAFVRLQKRTPVDLVVVDGHGIAHPRRFGIASHIGVVFDVPSIGVAKKKLYGSIVSKNGHEVIVDEHGEVIGVIIKSKRGSKIYVSPGHRLTPLSAAKLASTMITFHKLPEPTYIADTISKRVRASPRVRPGYIRCYDSSSRSISF